MNLNAWTLVFKQNLQIHHWMTSFTLFSKNYKIVLKIGDQIDSRNENIKQISRKKRKKKQFFSPKIRNLHCLKFEF